MLACVYQFRSCCVIRTNSNIIWNDWFVQGLHLVLPLTSYSDTELDFKNGSDELKVKLTQVWSQSHSCQSSLTPTLVSCVRVAPLPSRTWLKKKEKATQLLLCRWRHAEFQDWNCTRLVLILSTYQTSLA